MPPLKNYKPKTKDKPASVSFFRVAAQAIREDAEILPGLAGVSTFTPKNIPL
jgi:hypothetical protein